MSDDASTNRGERRAVPPASLDVVAYQVGALQTSLDRGLAALERSQDRGFADVRLEVATLSSEMASLKENFVRMDTRVEALETFKTNQEERERLERERAEERAENAAVDQTKYKTWTIILGPLVGIAVVGAFVLAVMQAFGGP